MGNFMSAKHSLWVAKFSGDDMVNRTIKTALAYIIIPLSLTACGNNSSSVSDVDETPPSKAEQTPDTSKSTTVTLESILAAQPDSIKSRYQYRQPAKTLAFFEIKPGMTVAEVLPGGGWYSKILLPYLGDDGTLIGIDYDIDMWPYFDGFVNEKFLQEREIWSETWRQEALDWRGEAQTNIEAFAFNAPKADLKNSADAVLMIRAMHHLTRFDEKYLNEALGNIKFILKPNGIVGIVQHRAAENMPNAWASGDNGYLKQSRVIEIMEKAGFEYVGESEINSNDKDVPTIDDDVWRLPPTLATSHNDPELKARMQAIGESDRMTLKFKYPASQ